MYKLITKTHTLLVDQEATINVNDVVTHYSKTAEDWLTSTHMYGKSLGIKVIAATPKLNDLPLIEEFKQNSNLISIDPPEGWKYGFPKQVTQEEYKQISSLKEWCIGNGYPKEEADKYGNYFNIGITGDLSFMKKDIIDSKLDDMMSDLIDEEQEQWKKHVKEVVFTPGHVLPISKYNQKQFKEFDESLFRAYINKFSKDDKFKAMLILKIELSE